VEAVAGSFTTSAVKSGRLVAEYRPRYVVLLKELSNKEESVVGEIRTVRSL
jgi:hypothetical protein